MTAGCGVNDLRYGVISDAGRYYVVDLEDVRPARRRFKSVGVVGDTEGYPTMKAGLLAATAIQRDRGGA